MILQSFASTCKSAAHKSSQPGRTSPNFPFVGSHTSDILASLTPLSTNDWSVSIEKVPAPTPFVRKQSSKAGLVVPISSRKGSEISPHTTYGVSEDMWSFLEPWTPNRMQYKYYAADRKCIANLLASSYDIEQDKWDSSTDGWDDALDALS
jgi:hypothetical protein